MIDAHCHLNDAKFPETELGEIVARATKAGVKKIVCNGAGLESSIAAIKIAEKFPQVYATVGIHPEEGGDLDLWGEEKLKSRLLAMCENRNVIAIGEAGLDYQNPTSEDIKVQKKLFEINLWLCQQTGLPLVVHNRNADDDIKEMMESHLTGAQLHCFVQDKDLIAWAQKRNFYVSFGGIITFKSSSHLRELAKECPRSMVLIETDSPYLAPEPFRGTRNEPANVKIVGQVLADTWGESLEQVDKITSDNFARLFTGRL